MTSDRAPTAPPQPPVLKTIAHPPPSASLEGGALTGLPNRAGLLERLAEPVREGWHRGVAALEIDALGLVNEAYGPGIGDGVPRELARRFNTLTGTTYLGRWRKDVFVWVLDAPDAAANLAELSHRVLARLHEPFEVGGDRLQLTTRMGLATDPAVPVADLLPAAMDALRAAKDAGRDHVVWYSDTMHPRHPRAAQLSDDLQHGIENGELRLHYQPIMDLTRDTVVGVEALVRWDRPGIGLLSPASFIEVAERTGQIIALGAWVARTACAAAVALQPHDETTLSVSMNVSARQLGDPGLVEMLKRALRDTGCPPSALTVEITETALLDDLEGAAVTLGAIKALGVRLDLDDFGTGYSSLLYLKHFPVDRIKIDQSFVAGLGSNHTDTTIVASTIALAHAVGIQAVAEGVETLAQLEMLRRMGCDYMQGYLLSHPLEADALTRWLTTRDAQALAVRGGGAADPPVDPDRATDRVRHRVANRRARQADQRDAVADGRDSTADQRDVVADGRDSTADQRDAVADLRDQAADRREDVAAQRHAPGDSRDGTDLGPSAHVHPAGAQDRAPEGPEAPRGRSRATRRRAEGANGRDRAGVGRALAAEDRESDAAQRLVAEHDRGITEAGTKHLT